jgi:hypothetical protein
MGDACPRLGALNRVPLDQQSIDGGRGPSTAGIRSLTEFPSLRMTGSWLRFFANAFIEGMS